VYVCLYLCRPEGGDRRLQGREGAEGEPGATGASQGEQETGSLPHGQGGIPGLGTKEI